jgi:serine/threonine protein kinase
MPSGGLPPLPRPPPPQPQAPGTPKSARAAQLQRELEGGAAAAMAVASSPGSPLAVAEKVLTFGADPHAEFEMLEKIGEGSFGAVWKALHNATGTQLAIKIVCIDENLEELYREVSTMAQLHHPNIIRFYTSYK